MGMERETIFNCYDIQENIFSNMRRGVIAAETVLWYFRFVKRVRHSPYKIFVTPLLCLQTTTAQRAALSFSVCRIRETMNPHILPIAAAALLGVTFILYIVSNAVPMW
jgi:hypothetical protein